ncbi:exodeoxyribonuclease III [Pelagibacterium xiamenense]|uniref:exodeoxyribonuclease III n=1 Tax=Pelagibacterium xiamenense TaxID=2901140 RepID=UPI001E42B9A5|nr:exodeoxyribonuclease III [Pelagibacterium xiamenense]MCD7058413.1 exodeoxyribonuclease III [Pelagibacterium xiamenense]
MPSLATWNINSVRLRLPIVLDFLAEYAPDVLCLQEIKCTNDQFPAKPFKQAGYAHQAVHGQKGYHGVAILSKSPIDEIATRGFCGIPDSRHVSARLDFGRGPVTVHNFYVPAGGDEPDPERNPKFRHKLDFLAEMSDWFDDLVFDDRQIICGDFNIAPHENDVWSHKQLLNVVSHTPVETEALNALLGRRNWVDLVRRHIPIEQKIYSWWSYRAKDWSASDRGRRLDHIWATRDIAAHSNACRILRPARGWSDKPSDHVPVIVDFG